MRPPPGRFLNARSGYGYTLDPRRVEIGRTGRKRWYEFRLIPEHPLAFADPDGGLWQPDRHETETDLGSVPVPMRGAFPQDEWLYSYIFHDSACRHGCLYFAVCWSDPFARVSMTRRQADAMLRDWWIPAEAAQTPGLERSAWRRWPVWVGVRAGAAAAAIRARCP